jgi:MFS-type transporter involved in bile tolerance (Atg22 family)
MRREGWSGEPFSDILRFIGIFIVILVGTTELLAAGSHVETAEGGERSITVVGALMKVIPLGIPAAGLVAVPVVAIEKLPNVPWPVCWLVGMITGASLGLIVRIASLFVSDPGSLIIYALVVSVASVWCAAWAVPLYVLSRRRRHRNRCSAAWLAVEDSNDDRLPRAF